MSTCDFENIDMGPHLRCTGQVNVLYLSEALPDACVIGVGHWTGQLVLFLFLNHFFCNQLCVAVPQEQLLLQAQIICGLMNIRERRSIINCWFMCFRRSV